MNRWFQIGFPLVVAAALAPACGSRSGLYVTVTADSGTPDTGPLPQCTITSDCEGAGDLCKPVSCVDGSCVKGKEIVCADSDPCTDDTCDGKTGLCNFKPSTYDLDGDGHRGPKPGTVAGAPGSCGDDCDDTRANAFPGNLEICDGVDNDCNGIIDDGAHYVAKTGTDGVRVSSSLIQISNPGGLAHDGHSYFASYTGAVDVKQRIYGSVLDIDGTRITQETRLSQVESDAFAGGVVWTGDRYAVVWEDRRFDGYEVFMAMFDATGKKMAPGDIRVSNSPEFSINSTIVWTGKEFVIAWQDGQGEDDTFHIYARRVDLDGNLISGITQLTTASDESPSLAVGRAGLGLVYVRGNTKEHHVMFQALDFNLVNIGNALELTTPASEGGKSASIVWNDPNFVVAWTSTGTTSAIFGASVTGTGTSSIAAKKLSDSPRFARDASVIALGDRLLLVYADSRDQNTGFELYTRTLNTQLVGTGGSSRITNHIGDSIDPVAKLGPQGEVGVLFGDGRDGALQTYFTHLVCEAGITNPPPPPLTTDAGVQNN